MATISQINIDDYHYDFIDVKSRNILTEFYDGNKIILDRDYSSTNNSAIDIYTPDPASSKTIQEKLIGVVDRAGKTRSCINWVNTTSELDTQSVLLRTEREMMGSTMSMSNSLTLNLGSNANPTIATPNQQAWRRALGFGDKINAIARSQIITPGSGITIVDAHYIERFNVAMLYLHFKYNKAISVPNHGNIADIKIGTLVEGKRPCHSSEACSNGDEGGAAWYDVAPSGNIVLCAIEGMSTTRTIAANTQFNLASTYLVR